MNEWIFLMCTIPDTDDLFQFLENTIRHQLLPALTGRLSFSDAERELIALTTRHEGHGIPYITLPLNLLAGSLMSTQRSRLPWWTSSCLRPSATPTRCSWNRGRSRPNYAISIDPTLQKRLMHWSPHCPRPSEWRWSKPVKREHPPGSLPSLWQGTASTCTSSPWWRKGQTLSNGSWRWSMGRSPPSPIFQWWMGASALLSRG